MIADLASWQRRVVEAHERIRPAVLETAVDVTTEVTPEISAPVAFKLEHQQRTGSFKLRGAANRIGVLSREEANAGVLASSMGNHGLAVAVAARAAGVEAEVYLCSQVSRARVELIASQGARVHIVGDDPLEAELAARQAAEESGRVYISPYNDPHVIAGQGTIALELTRQVPRIDAIFVAVGGGGLVSGIGAYLKAVAPQTQIVGCWPQNAPALHECLQQGRIVSVEEQPTLSESTAGGVEPDSITLELGQRVIDASVLVSEEEILSAMRRLHDARGWLVEGAAGVALAGLLRLRQQFAGKSVAVVLCGGNLSPEVRELLQ